MRTIGALEQHALFEIKLLDCPVQIVCDDASRLEEVLSDTTYLCYRMGSINIAREPTKREPDLLLLSREREKSLDVVDGRLVLKGRWSDGEINRLLVALLARSLENNMFYPLHASAFHYKGFNVILMGGEENHGKTMSLIESANRGGALVATESLIMDGDCQIVSGTKEVFLRRRQKGTERSDKPSTEQGVYKFFSRLPEFKYRDPPLKPSLVVLPDIDGNFDTNAIELSQFEKEYQTFHSICNFYSTHSIIDSGIAMPLIDSNQARARRARFVHKLASLYPYFLIRGPSPQKILDEIERILPGVGG